MGYPDNTDFHQDTQFDDPVGANSEDVDLTKFGAGIDLVRVINRTIHVSTIDRKKEVDFQIRNPSEESKYAIFLPLRKFATNLQVEDATGKRLSYYPNFYVNNLLPDGIDIDTLKEDVPMFKGVEQILLIQFSPDNPLEPGELRTIRLTFEQSDPVKFHNILGWGEGGYGIGLKKGSSIFHIF